MPLLLILFCFISCAQASEPFSELQSLSRSLTALSETSLLGISSPLAKEINIFETFFQKLRNPDQSYLDAQQEIIRLKKIIEEPLTNLVLFRQNLQQIAGKLETHSAPMQEIIKKLTQQRKLVLSETQARNTMLKIIKELNNLVLVPDLIFEKLHASLQQEFLKTPVSQSEPAMKTEAEIKQAEDILNFLILFYLDPSGNLKREWELMNTTSKQTALDIFQSHYPLAELYKNWEKKLSEISQAARTTEILHADELEIFKDPKKLPEIKEINRLILSNYNVNTAQFSKDIRKELRHKILALRLSNYPKLLGYKTWEDKLAKQYQET